MNVGRRIKEQLGILGMSQSELARRVGVDQSTINGLVRGNAQTSRHLHRIAQELRTTAAYLSGDTDDPSAEVVAEEFTSQERDWIDLLRGLQVRDRQAVLQLTRSLATCAQTQTLHDKTIDYRAE